jgi:hypothetical protein
LVAMRVRHYYSARKIQRRDWCRRTANLYIFAYRAGARRAVRAREKRRRRRRQ